MNGKQWEIYAAYGGLRASDLARIMGDRNLNPFTQAQLLASALAMPFKETGRAHYRTLVQEQRGYPKQIDEGLEWLQRLGLERSLAGDLATLPRYSFALEFQFVLARPYLSQDDDAFYVIDNPVRKDKVFKVPYVAPTSWKGNLRAAATQGLLEAFTELLPKNRPIEEAEREELLATLWAERARRVALFGNEKKNEADFLNRWLAARLLPEPSGQDEREREKQVEKEARRLGENFENYLIRHGYRTEKIEGRQGRLFCFPTFFDRIGLEIINPHDRERRVGKNPILFECVPAGAKGAFRLLYVPYDFPGEVTPDEPELQRQVQADLPLVAKAVRNMFTVYGFGAKTSSGFGTAEDRLATEGKLVLRMELPGVTPQAPAGPQPEPAPDLPRYLESPTRLHPDFRRADGTLKTEQEYQALIEGRGQKYAKKDRQLYEKAKAWWEREGRRLAESPPEAPEPVAEPAPAPAIAEWTFTTLSELVEIARQVATLLREGGAA